MVIRKGDRAMMKTKIVTAAAMIVGAIVLVSAPAAEAGKAKKKSDTKRAAITQPVTINMACEGRVATVTTTPFSTPTRDETSISFWLSVSRASGVATIMRSSGTRIIRSGRYAMFASEGGMDINMNWTDSNNQGQAFTLTFRADGAFSGDTQSSQPNNIGVELMRQILGPDYAPVMDIITRHRVEGSCWHQ
jgi:hypothetical protein